LEDRRHINIRNGNGNNDMQLMPKIIIHIKNSKSIPLSGGSGYYYYSKVNTP
jgi:hypothetical protein